MQLELVINMIDFILKLHKPRHKDPLSLTRFLEIWTWNLALQDHVCQEPKHLYTQVHICTQLYTVVHSCTQLCVKNLNTCTHKYTYDHFWGQKPWRMTFPEHFLRLAGFGQMTHLNSRVGNGTWTSLGDEFEVPMDHFWGQKPLQNDFSRAFPEIGWVLSNGTP